MPPTENNGSPMIPAGTEKTVFGTNTFGPVPSNPNLPNPGQALPTPVPAQVQQAQDNAPQGTTFSELAAKKGFQSPDDLAKAYTELESHNKKVEMSAADILKYVEQPQQTQQPLAPAQAQGSDADAIKIVEAIVDSRTKPLKEQIALQELFLKNPDAKDYAEGIAKAVKDNPGLSWDNALKIAKYDSVELKSKEAGRSEAYQNIQQKTASVTGSPTPASRNQPDLRAIIKDRSVPFSEVSRIMREALNQ